MTNLQEVLVILGIPIVLLVFVLPQILVITLNIKTALGTKYSRLKYWIWSVILIIPQMFALIINELPTGDIENTNTLTILFIALILMLPSLLWINALVNRIRDYGNNPWIALWTVIPVGNVIIGLYYGIAKHKATRKESYFKDSSLDKVVHNHDENITSEVNPTINEHTKSNQASKTESTSIEIEDEIYEQVMLEIEEDRKVRATWGKAFAQSDGDENKALSLYIKYRSEAIKRGKQEAINKQKEYDQELKRESEWDRKYAILQQEVRDDLKKVKEKEDIKNTHTSYDDKEEVKKTYTKLDVFFNPNNYTEEEKKKILGDEYE